MPVKGSVLRGGTLLALLAWGADAGAADAGSADAGSCAVSFPATNASVTYQGGQILSAARVVPVMWTSAVSQEIQSWAQPYFSTLTGSAYFDLLSQYGTPAVATGGTGQTLGHGTATAPVVITPTAATGTTVDDSAIGPELQDQISSGQLPPPTPDAQGFASTVYAVFFPKGTTITINGSSSCVTFCGYRTGYPTAGKISFGYVVVPDASPGGGCEYCGDPCTTGAVPIASSVSSALIAEAVTNPVSTQGWLSPTLTDTISTLCGGGGVVTGIVPGTSVLAHYVWSQRDGQCLIAPGTGSGSGGSSGSGDPFGSSSGNPFGSSTGGSSGAVSSGSGSGGASSGGGGAPAPAGGCGCAVPGRGATGTGLVALAGVAALAVARARRRR